MSNNTSSPATSTSRYLTGQLMQVENGLTRISLMEYDTAFLLSSAFSKGRFNRDTAAEILGDPDLHSSRSAVYNSIVADIFYTGMFTLDKALHMIARTPSEKGMEAVNGRVINGEFFFPHDKAEQLVKEIHRIAPHSGRHQFPVVTYADNVHKDYNRWLEFSVQWEISLIHSILRSLRLSKDWRVNVRFHSTEFRDREGFERVVGEYACAILNLAECMAGYKGTHLARYLNETYGYVIVK